MENKYYIPKESEFYIGFECEYYSNHCEKYLPIIIDSSNFELNSMDGSFDDDYVLSYNYSKPNKFRVKYLDKEDIESFGFICAGIGEYQKLDDNTDDFIIVDTNFVDDLNVRICYEKSTGENVSTEYTMFDGAIKNKSEFKKLLIQLNIINE